MCSIKDPGGQLRNKKVPMEHRRSENQWTESSEGGGERRGWPWTWIRHTAGLKTTRVIGFNVFESFSRVSHGQLSRNATARPYASSGAALHATTYVNYASSIRISKSEFIAIVPYTCLLFTRVITSLFDQDRLRYKNWAGRKKSTIHMTMSKGLEFRGWCLDADSIAFLWYLGIIKIEINWN